jgi:hypothetical protein
VVLWRLRRESEAGVDELVSVIDEAMTDGDAE